QMVTSFSPAITAVANGFTTQLADSMSQTQDQVVDWSQAFGNILVTTLDVGRDAVFALSKAFEVLGSAIGAVAAALDRVIHGKFQQAGEVFKAFGDDVEKINDEILSFNTRKFRDELDKARASAKQFGQSGSQSVYLGIGDSGQGTGNVASATSSGESEYQKRIEEIKSMRDLGFIDEKEKLDEIERAHKAMADAMKDDTGRMSQFAIQASRNIQDTLGDTLQKTLSGHFDNILGLWTNM